MTGNKAQAAAVDILKELDADILFREFRQDMTLYQGSTFFDAIIKAYLRGQQDLLEAARIVSHVERQPIGNETEDTRSVFLSDLESLVKGEW